jgi:hypothetical protein
MASLLAAQLPAASIEGRSTAASGAKIHTWGKQTQWPIGVPNCCQSLLSTYLVNADGVGKRHPYVAGLGQLPRADTRQDRCNDKTRARLLGSDRPRR